MLMRIPSCIHYLAWYSTAAAAPVPEAVTMANVHQYVRLVVEKWTGWGITGQAQAFVQGCTEVFPVRDA
jgi:hypothetical protein